MFVPKRKLSVCFLVVLFSAASLAQQSSPGAQVQANDQTNSQAPLTDRERMLLDRIASLEQRVEALEGKLGLPNTAAAAPIPAAVAPPPPTQVDKMTAASLPALAPAASTPASAGGPVESAAQTKGSEPPSIAPFLGGTTLNVNLDAYYGYNFNNPIGRVNLLRAYDVSSNAISLNQADLILDNQPDPSNGKRWGFRLDFQYGQATETLQGNPANEPRPDIYRSIFQAYGSYVIPVGKGLTVDFGKFASSLGYEGIYTKDQMNYSRGFWYTFLPFYHMGARLNYKFNEAFAVNYWLVNGTQQTEPFNGYKDEFFGLAFTPGKKVSWNVNYYLGQEQPDVIYFPNGGAPAGAPTLQGVPFEPISNPPRGKLHIFDTYLSWQTTPKLTLTAELDDEIERLYQSSAPFHTDGGGLWAQYQFTPKLSFAGRAEYLSDRGGLFTGLTQVVKETTFTTKYQMANGFDLFAEWRRDFSNRPFFYTDTLGLLKKEQNTAMLGLVWWFGAKQGSW